MTSVLIVLSGADELRLRDGDTHQTGFWPEELVVPVEALTALGVATTIATPAGQPAHADPAGYLPEATGYDQQQCDQLRESVGHLRPELENPQPLKSIDALDFDALFVPGGHGPMADLCADTDCGRIVREMIAAGRPVAAVCHGPAALLPAFDQNGRWLFAGYAMTGFSNTEEGHVGLRERMPWTLEDQLNTEGARFSAAPPWTENVVVDRNLLTGQNPASAGPLAAHLFEALCTT